MRGAIRDARTYELMTIFSPDVAEDEIQTTIDAVVGYITGASGEHVAFNRDSPWGRRRLAYAIRHASRDVRDGFYTLYHFQVAPHRVIDIEREIKLNDRIMRYLLTQYTPRPVDESATAQAPEETTEASTSDGSDESVGDDSVIDESPAEPAAEDQALDTESSEEPSTEEA